MDVEVYINTCVDLPSIYALCVVLSMLFVYGKSSHEYTQLIVSFCVSRCGCVHMRIAADFAS